MILRRRIPYHDLVSFDRNRRRSSDRLIAGVDEAGRGALAGPVVAASVICEPHEELIMVTDSKRLREPVRERLYGLIRERSLALGIGIVGPDEIDRLNIFRATLEAMRIAVESLDPSPCLVLVDGRHIPSLKVPAIAVKGGDGQSFSIAAASIVAKVTRDRIMRERSSEFPGYGFKRNKGYGTMEHIRAIKKRGWTHFHRLSFRIHSFG